jgi:predicted dehydrogenase
VPGRTIGIGLVGVGWMGNVHSQAYRRVRAHYPDVDARARLVAAADEVGERARDAVERFGYERWTTDWRDVLEDPAVDAISICAPNVLHREIALAAAGAGKHVWIEKPVGRVPAETVEIADAAESAGIVTTVGLNYRNPPAVQYAKQLIDAGALGEINQFRMHFLASYSSNPRGALSWRFVRELGGLGILGDLGSHAVDLAQFLLGPIVRVSASSRICIPRRPLPRAGAESHFAIGEADAELGDVENEDWAAAIVEFASGVRGTIELSRVTVGAEARYAFEVGGTDGAVSWDFEQLNELQIHDATSTGDRGWTRVLMGPPHPEFARFQPGQGIPMGYDDLKVIEAARFLESIADGVQREPGMREIRAAAHVIAAIVRSCESGRWEDVARTGAQMPA